MATDDDFEAAAGISLFASYRNWSELWPSDRYSWTCFAAPADAPSAITAPASMSSASNSWVGS